MALTKATLTGTINNIKEGWTKFNDLIDDLLSTSNALGASQIGIEDTAGNMAAANVEDGLAEIYTDTEEIRSSIVCHANAVVCHNNIIIYN